MDAPPVFADSTNYHLKATLKTGSFDLVNPALLIELRLSDKVSASFSGEWLSSSGKYKFRYRRKAVMTDEIMYDTTAVRQNGDVRATRMEGALFGTISGGEWMLKAYNYTSGAACRGPLSTMFGAAVSASGTTTRLCKAQYRKISAAVITPV